MSKYLVCYACDAKGHISKECPNKDKFVGGSMKENYKYCGRCDKYGHTTFECYSDGGPVNWSRVSQKEMKCYNCNDFGHIARNCPADKRPPSSLGSRASHVDRTLLPVKLNMGVSSLDGQNIPATPQSLLDAAVYRYNRKEGLLSSENSWLCASLMVKNFMYQYNFDPKSHKIKDVIVQYLSSSLADKNLQRDFPTAGLF